jgi:geranylgeranyl diphosphate synthase type I
MTGAEVTARDRAAHEVLTWSRNLVEPALRSAVDTLPESMRGIAGYHFGWWDEHGRLAGAPGGKSLRPALVLLAARAVGAEPTVAVPAAVAVELVHNFSLVHDDVMDEDVTRRHRPTAWRVFGTDAAILAGDALLTLAFEVLADSAHPAAAPGVRLLGAAVRDLLDGQAADLRFEQRDDVDLIDCVRMAERKTGALLGCACAIGGLFGGAIERRQAALRGFGVRLGLAFQIVDDLLGIWGDPGVTGKPVYSDLRSRKKSLPVVAALVSGTDAGRELAALYRRGRQPAGIDLGRAADLVELAGGRAWSRTKADELVARALSELTAAAPTEAAERGFAALARLATHRDG